MPSPLLEQLQTDITDVIEEKLKHQEITPERAGEIAQFVLDALPENITDDQIVQVLPGLDDRFTELAAIVHEYLIAYEHAHQKPTEESAEKLIAKGKLEEASKLMKEYFAHKLK